MIIKVFGRVFEDVCEIEQAQPVLDFKSGTILVEGQKVQSYAELVELATSEQYRNKNSIEVMILPAILGG